MVALTDKTINEYITDILGKLPSEINNDVKGRHKSFRDYINFNKPINITFIDCIDIYIFGICLIQVLVKLEDISPVLDLVNEIFLTINTYLYRKQYNIEKAYTSYEPDTKVVINSIIDKKNNQPTFVELADIPLMSADSMKQLDSVAIPKLDTEINTEAKLLKTSGLMNSEIAKLIGDGSFNNVSTLPLTWWSLSNQFVVRCRRSQDYDIIYYKDESIHDININKELYKNLINEDNQPKINKYYLIYFQIINKRLENPILLLNSIAHIEFKSGYLNNLKKELDKPLKERYLFTFGTFSGFKSSIFDRIGHNHRCALIFDKKDKIIYFFDTLLETATFLYMFDKIENVSLLHNSISIACTYKFGSIDFIKNVGYKFNMTYINMQYYDIAYKNIITASTYYRYYKKKTNKPTYMDWSGGYCGAYVLLLLVLMSMNPHLELLVILTILARISNSKYANHNFLIMLIRSFAQQIENIINDPNAKIQLDNFNFQKYVASKGATIEINKTLTIPLKPGMHDYNVIDPLNPTGSQINIAKQIVRNSNKETLKENKDKIIDKIIAKNLQSVYLGNLSLMFTTIGAMFKSINKLQTELTPAQQQWKFEHYGPDDLVYFISY